MDDELVMFNDVARPYRPSKDTDGTHTYNDTYSNMTLLCVQETDMYSNKNRTRRFTPQLMSQNSVVCFFVLWESAS